jgi:anti-sigma B factor antagonist
MEQSQIEVRTRKLQAGVYVIAPAGRLDAETARLLDDEVSLLNEVWPSLVVVDLSDARIADSAALSALVLAQKRLRYRGATLALVCLERRALELLERTGLAHVFLIERSISRAVDRGPSGSRVQVATSL